MDSEAQQAAWSIGRWVARGAFLLVTVTFFIQWLVPRLRKWNRLHATQSRSDAFTGHNLEEEADRRRKQESLHKELQDKHAEKAASYKERIMRPREEAKKQKKEEEFYKFLGPAWKGKGQVLGDDEDQKEVQEELDEFEGELNPREMAALRRRIQKPTPQPAKPPEKPKKVITLPEEPEEGDAESVLVLLRSPIQTVYRRRFRHSDTVQALLDFMTVSGFTQTFNTLCTSYPRHDLAQNKEATLSELGFTRRVTLNIEEKDL